MKKGISLVELTVSVLIFTFVSAVVLSVIILSQRSWSTGQNKLIEQQEARKAMDNIVKFLRQSSPQYGISIGTPEQNKILFYKPIFDEFGITGTHWIIFKLDPNNLTQLIRKEEGGDWVTVATHIQSVKFYGGSCTGSGCDFTNPSCVSVNNNCPLLKIVIKTYKEREFSLLSYVALRNSESQVTEPPPEGEF